MEKLPETIAQLRSFYVTVMLFDDSNECRAMPGVSTATEFVAKRRAFTVCLLHSTILSNQLQLLDMMANSTYEPTTWPRRDIDKTCSLPLKITGEPLSFLCCCMRPRMVSS
jgi:hypothetical protein